MLPTAREPSRSLSTRGSALLARFDECGPAVVEPTALPSGYDPVVPDVYCDLDVGLEWPPRGKERPVSGA